MNDLVPFEFESLKAAEVVWPDLRSVRFPRAEVGRMFRDHTWRGATHDLSPRRRSVDYTNVVQTIIKRTPDLKDLGVPLQVRGLAGTQGDRPYTAVCYSLDEIHELAIHSNLPGAKNFLHIYPRLKEAEVLGRFTRVCPKEFRERVIIEKVDEVLALPPGSEERKEATSSFLNISGRSKDTLRRYLMKRALGQIPPLRKGRSDRGTFRKFPLELQEKAKKILWAAPKIRTAALHKLLDAQVSYSAVRRWRAQVQAEGKAA